MGDAHYLPQPALPEVPELAGRGGREWLAEREAELLPVPYFHVVFTLPADRRHRLPEQGRDLRPAVQGLVRDHAHDRSRSQAPRRSHRLLSVLHTWGSAMTHHPHVHMIVPGGGISGLVT